MAKYHEMVFFGWSPSNNFRIRTGLFGFLKIERLWTRDEERKWVKETNFATPFPSSLMMWGGVDEK